MGDLNADGRDDVAVVGTQWGLFHERPGGGLAEVDGLELPQGYTRVGGIEIGDVTGDGVGDISCAHSWNGLLVLRSRSASWPLPAWVRDTSPADGAQRVAGTVPEVRFARTLDPASVTPETVRPERAGTAAPVPMSLSYDGAAVRIQPATALSAGRYVVRVDGVRNVRGARLDEEHTLRFVVGSGGDFTAPDTVISSGPSGTVKSQSPDFWAYSTEPGARLHCDPTDDPKRMQQ